MKILELFSGTESFSNVARARGHQVFTIENNAEFNPSLCKNILDVTIKDIPFKPDVIWASPPCTCFSVASIGRSWCGNYCPSRTETALGMAYVLKTLELIKKLKPKYFFIENPRGVLRKMAFMDELPIRNTVTYCQYGDTRMKPTDIWTNCSFWKPKQMCKNGDSCHIPAPRGSKTGTQGLKGSKNRSIVPEKLCLEILKSCEQLITNPSTLPNGNPNGEFNISLKDNSNELSQISSNDETSLNNNIMFNSDKALVGMEKQDGN